VVAASGGASQDSGSYCRPVASVNSGAQWNRSHGCLQPSTHGEGGLPVRTRRVVMDDFAMLGRGRLVTDRGRCSLRTTYPVLQVVLLVGPDAGGEEGVRLQPEELRPGRADPAGRWAEASPSEHRGDGRCRDIDPELQELAPDPEVAPSGILPSQTKDQLLDRGIDGRATRPAGPASPTDRELSVPPDERVSADQEALPPVRREESGRRGEERPISGGEPGSHPSSPEDLQLMAEHDRLQIPLPEAAPNQQAKQTAEEPIPQSQEHGPSLDWWRPAGEWRGQSADRVSLPHRLPAPQGRTPAAWRARLRHRDPVHATPPRAGSGAATHDHHLAEVPAPAGRWDGGVRPASPSTPSGCAGCTCCSSSSWTADGSTWPGVTANPDGAWVTQQARNLLLALEERGRRVRFLLRDRDAKFCRGFDDVFRAEGAEVLLTPVRAPNANAYAERWVRTVRSECLDWLLIVGRGHLERVLRVYVAHYNRHRPHRALELQPPDPSAEITILTEARPGQVHRHDLLGGLLREYRRAA
jgi:hypothetical protein